MKDGMMRFIIYRKNVSIYGTVLFEPLMIEVM